MRGGDFREHFVYRHGWRALCRRDGADFAIGPGDDFFFECERDACEAHDRNDDSGADPDDEMRPKNCLAEASTHEPNLENAPQYSYRTVANL